jgi:hypothetical protein
VTYLRLIPLVCLTFCAACSSDPTEPDTGTAGSGGSAAGETSSAGKSNGGGGSSGLTRCPEGENPNSAPNPIEVGSISGLIVDEQGKPTNAGLVQVCGKDVCTQANVERDGKLIENVGDTRDTPAVKFGDGFDWAKLLVLLGEGDNALGTLTTVRLPSYADGVALVAGESATSGGVTLSLAEDAHVDVNFLDYEDESQQVFRAAALTEPALAQLKQGFVQGYALSPLETKLCPSPALSLDNTSGLEPGTALELYILGLSVDEEFADYGTWQKVGEGAVSDDGEALEFPEGVPVLSAIGVKVKE